MMCHGADHEKMARTPHAVAADSRNVGCIGCHGGSSEHADNPTEKKPDQVFKGKNAVTGAAASEACLACHTTASTKQMLLWAGSTHPQAGRGLHQLPHDPRQQGQALQQGRTAVGVLHLSQGRPRRRQQAMAAPGAGRQGHLLGLPLGAWLGRPQAGQARHRQHDLLHVPRRQARPVRAEPRAGAGQLCELPQPARQQHQCDAALARSDPLQPVPHAAHGGRHGCCRRAARGVPAGGATADGVGRDASVRAVSTRSMSGRAAAA